jgi:hypothetical protein
MRARSPSSRFVLWAAMFALLLKAAVPLLASVAAQARGVPVAEVCAVYGVALPAAHDAHAGHHHHAQHEAPSTGQEHERHGLVTHGGDHCALQGLAALALPDIGPAGIVPTGRVEAPPPRGHAQPAAAHDCAQWVARLKQGPPLLA